MFCSICNSEKCCEWKNKLKCKLHKFNWRRIKINLPIVSMIEFQYTEKRKNEFSNKEKEKISKCLQNIKYRCSNPIDRKYKYYGGKGIKCNLNIEEIKFLWKRDKALRMKQLTIDRINPLENYTLWNCQFIEMQENRKASHSYHRNKFILENK